MKNLVHINEYSVILRNINNDNNLPHSFSIAKSMKPLVYFSSAFGMQMVNYSSNNIIEGKVIGKLYCMLFVFVTISLYVFVKPFSWRYTQKDVPLNVLTKCFGIFSASEALYSVVIMTFAKSSHYVELFKILDNLDSHFGISKTMEKKRFIMSICLIVLPLFQVSCTFWMRKFSIYNIGTHLIFFLIVLQGAIIIFFVFNIFLKYLMFNYLLTKKTNLKISQPKRILFQDSIFNWIVKLVLKMEPLYVENKNRSYCWFELMQIYDKLADCIYVFNQIYGGQVLIMFSSWMLCTLLVICRSLSPTVKYSEVILSDLFMYTSLNIRPIFLTKMCELLIDERKKTLAILMNYAVYGDLDDAYFEQLHTMMDLVETRKMEVSGEVFTANAPSVLSFSGRTISYAVLMIQYFYMHMFLE